MKNTTRGYLDALRALSGDREFKDGRHNLIRGLSDATVNDIIADCLKVTSSRVVREHIIRLLLDTIAEQRPSQTHGSGHGYLDALCALSGDPNLAAARHDLIEHLTDNTLNEVITHCLSRDTTRASQQQVMGFLLDIIAEQTQSRAQEGAAAVKVEDEEELPEHDAEDRQKRVEATRDMVEEEVPTVQSEGEAAEQDGAMATEQMMDADANTDRKRRTVDDPSCPAKRARNLQDSSTSAQNATPDDYGVIVTDIKREEKEEIETAQQIPVTEGQAPQHSAYIGVRLRMSDGNAEGKELHKLPSNVQAHLLQSLLDDYGFDSNDQATYDNILRYGTPSKWRYHCIHTFLHGRGPCYGCMAFRQQRVITAWRPVSSVQGSRISRRNIVS